MIKRDIVVVGAGGFGREVMYQLLDADKDKNEYNALGFVDDAPDILGTDINGYKVLGNLEWLSNYDRDICVAVGVGNSKTRKNIVNKLKKNTYITFPTIIASDVKCSATVTLGEGCIICLSNILTVNITLGNFVTMNLDCTVGHSAILEDFVTLYPSVNVSGDVHIGACTEAGTGVNIIQGINIGENVIIGAGAVVVRDLPPNCVAVGAPAKPLEKK